MNLILLIADMPAARICGLAGASSAAAGLQAGFGVLTVDGAPPGAPMS
jgi:hypothetical protein